MYNPQLTGSDFFLTPHEAQFMIFQFYHDDSFWEYATNIAYRSNFAAGRLVQDFLGRGQSPTFDFVAEHGFEIPDDLFQGVLKNKRSQKIFIRCVLRK